MWGHLIKLLSLGKGALVVGVAASAAMVSTAEISNAPSHHDEPSATPIALVSAPPTAKVEASTKPTDKPKSIEQPKSTEPGKPDVSGVVKECLEKYAALRAAGDSASNGDRESTAAVCKTAIEQSGLTTKEFAEKYGFDKLPSPQPNTPKTEHSTAGLEAAIHQCLIDWRNYAETSSAACAQALAASGLSSEDFWKKFEAWAVEQPNGDTTTDINALVKECFAKYTAKDPTTLETCKKAMAASGLSGDAFWDKYGRPTPPTTAPKSSTSEETYKLMALCFKLHSALTSTSEKATIDAAYDACNKAIAASGMSVNDFWAKYAKELAPAKPSTSPKSSTSEETYRLVATCIRLRNEITDTSDKVKVAALTEACNKAFAATGMTSLEFWTKFGSQLTNNPYAPKPSVTPSPKPVTNPDEVAALIAKCVDLYKNLSSTGDTKTVSDTCKLAIQVSGLSSADFWSKYNPYVTH